MRVSELIHSENPWRSRLRWLFVFSLLVGSLIIAAFAMLGHIRSYSLPSGGVRLTMEYSTYLVGEPVNFTINNGFNSPISISTNCPSEPITVYRSVNKQWVRVHDLTSVANCSTSSTLLQIPASGSSTVSFANWPHLFSVPGDYRLALQVQYSNALPYADFTIINPPAAYIATLSNSASNPIFQSSGTFGGGSVTQTTPSTSVRVGSPTTTTPTTTPTTPPDTTPPPKRTPQTVVLYVNSAGNYTTTNIHMYTGDTLKIVYQTPYNNEVRTRFSTTNGTTAAISSMTVDSEFTSISRQLTSAGSWSYKADDHSGNSGSLLVSP